jgi:hypothetical protein
MNHARDGYMANGVGAPSVAYDTVRGRYVMVFEVRLPESDPNCPVGRWGLGLAVSTDGINWTAGASPLFEPKDGTYFSCVAAHPTVFFGEGADQIVVLFKAEQGLDACDGGTPSWGCEQYTGVGRMRARFQPAGGVSRTYHTAEPVLALDENFGFPKVVRSAGVWYMMLTKRPSAFMATSGALSDFTLIPEPVLEPGLTSWTEDELFNPAMVCEDSPIFPLTSYVGGRDTNVIGMVEYAGWGKAISSTGIDWLLGAAPYFEWVDDSEWRHWDVLRVGASDQLVFFSEKDGTGRNRIRLATTTPVWSDADVYTKVCL